MGIPADRFTVVFALGRLPGWIPQVREPRAEDAGCIHRPRRVHTGATLRHVA